MKQKNNKRTTTALTAGALLFHEMEAVQHFLISEDMVGLLANEIIQNQFLKIKSQEARKRIVTEIRRRISAVDKAFWATWIDFSTEEKRLGLFYVILKTYSIAFDLHFEVTLPKWRAKQFEMEIVNYQMRMDELASQGHIAEKWTETTRKRTISHYITMLRGAGLMNKNTLQHPVNISIEFWKFMAKAANPWFFEACLLNKIEREKYT